MVGFFSKGTKESAKLPIPKAPEKTDSHEQDAPREQPRSQQPQQRPQAAGGQMEQIPPLFIKIDKYGEVVKNIQRLKSFALGLRDAIDALSDIEKELSTGLSIANRALDNFNTTISLLDAKLLRVAGTNLTDAEVDVPDELDSYVKNIYDQMNKLKHELKSIE
jgi:hypothetical protein